MNDEILQSMDTDEFEVFMDCCVNEAEKIGVDVNYYIMEFLL